MAIGLCKQLGKPDFGATAFMTGSADKLHTIETSGNLYEVNVK